MIWYLLTAFLVGLAVALTFYSSGFNTSKINHIMAAFVIGACVALFWPIFILAVDSLLIYNICVRKSKTDELKKTKNELLEDFVHESMKHNHDIDSSINE